MNNKAVTLSLLMGLMAVFFVQSYVESIENDAEKKYGSQVLVVKASKDILEQETINETHIKLDLIPEKFAEPSAITFAASTDSDRAEKQKQIMRSLAGAVSVVPIKEGEQITRNKLTEPGIRSGLSPQITPGKRAIAVPVNEVSGVAKLVKPGDRVDLIAVLDSGQGVENRISKTVLQDVVVLSVGRNVTNNVSRLVQPDAFTGKVNYKSLSQDVSFTSVTLEVDPQQAEMLALVMSNRDNALTLALRNNDDMDRVKTQSVSLSDVAGAELQEIKRKVASERRR